jgi:hypothetical protein
VHPGLRARAAAREEKAREAAEIVTWRDQHCTLEHKAPESFVECRPVCVKETVYPCPEYRCRKKPPNPEWLASWNRQACADHRGPNRVARLSRTTESLKTSPCAELESERGSAP